MRDDNWVLTAGEGEPAEQPAESRNEAEIREAIMEQEDKADLEVERRAVNV